MAIGCVATPPTPELGAVVTDEVDQERRSAPVALHQALDSGAASGLSLACQYVDEGSLAELDAAHPTRRHRRMVDRALSGITRAELSGTGAPSWGVPRTMSCRR